MEYMEIIVSLVVLASAFFGGVSYIMRLSTKPINDNIKLSTKPINDNINKIQTDLSNHITETNDKIDTLRKEQKEDFKHLNKRFDNLYEILLNKNEDNK